MKNFYQSKIPPRKNHILLFHQQLFHENLFLRKKKYKYILHSFITLSVLVHKHTIDRVSLYTLSLYISFRLPFKWKIKKITSSLFFLFVYSFSSLAFYKTFLFYLIHSIKRDDWLFWIVWHDVISVFDAWKISGECMRCGGVCMN